MDDHQKSKEWFVNLFGMLHKKEVTCCPDNSYFTIIALHDLSKRSLDCSLSSMTLSVGSSGGCVEIALIAAHSALNIVDESRNIFAI